MRYLTAQFTVQKEHLPVGALVSWSAPRVPLISKEPSKNIGMDGVKNLHGIPEKRLESKNNVCGIMPHPGLLLKSQDRFGTRIALGCGLISLGGFRKPSSYKSSIPPCPTGSREAYGLPQGDPSKSVGKSLSSIPAKRQCGCGRHKRGTIHDGADSLKIEIRNNANRYDNDNDNRIVN